MEESEVQKFYKSCNVFITGGTGFMGKVLIEKLLRSTEVSTLYILVREKKGKNMHTRIDELFDDVLFDRLKIECPKFKHRIEAVSGDCSMTDLGLSITDRHKLITNIHVVFHMAATVRFDENLKLAYAINVNGTKDVLEMAKQMQNLKALVHVSTAYANCHLNEIEEKFYDCPHSYEAVEAMVEKKSKHEVELLTPRIIGSWPNTYTFTKALAESMINNTTSGLPVGVFRPAIVISTYKEPIEGWTDNFYGTAGVCAGKMAGVLRVMPCNSDLRCDLVPVDTCVAGLIASAWDVASKDCERTPENIPIYNYVSSIENPITWSEFIKLNLIHGKQYPIGNSVWYATSICTPNAAAFWLLQMLLHLLPAVVFDFGAVISGHKPRLLQLYKRIHKMCGALGYFCVRDWTFSNKNTVNLWLKLNNTDKELFPLSITTVHWLLLTKKYVKGLRLYLLKDPDSTLDMARKRNKRLHILHEAMKIVVAFTVCSLALSLCSKVLHTLF